MGQDKVHGLKWSLNAASNTASSASCHPLIHPLAELTELLATTWCNVILGSQPPQKGLQVPICRLYTPGAYKVITAQHRCSTRREPAPATLSKLVEALAHAASGPAPPPPPEPQPPPAAGKVTSTAGVAIMHQALTMSTAPDCSRGSTASTPVLTASVTAALMPRDLMSAASAPAATAAAAGLPADSKKGSICSHQHTTTAHTNVFTPATTTDSTRHQFIQVLLNVKCCSVSCKRNVERV